LLIIITTTEQDDDLRHTLAYCTSFANDDDNDSTTSTPPTTMRHFDRNLAYQLDDLMTGQLSYCRQQYQKHQLPVRSSTTTTIIDHRPLPNRWDDAVMCQNSRAIVITEPTRPFRIVHVNAAWEQLCGYTRKEAYGQSLGYLLHGHDTDRPHITSMLHPLLQLQLPIMDDTMTGNSSVVVESGTVVTNYTKTGRRFRNRVRIGPLFRNDDDDYHTPPTTTTTATATSFAPHHQYRRPTHFVGVLQEIHDGM
jgi:PAS domain-containing protein